MVRRQGPAPPTTGTRHLAKQALRYPHVYDGHGARSVTRREAQGHQLLANLTRVGPSPNEPRPPLIVVFPPQIVVERLPELALS
jgi:hypothetical protein